MRHYAISSSGTLAYVPAATAYALVLVGGDGAERLITEEQRLFENPQFSPDGRRVTVATSRRQGEPLDLWIHELDTGTATRLTFDGGRAPVWTADGTTVTYSHLGERGGIYARRVDGRGGATQLLAVDAFHWFWGGTPIEHASAMPVHKCFEIQLCDAKPNGLSAMEMARHHRHFPGEGDWPVRAR